MRRFVSAAFMGVVLTAAPALAANVAPVSYTFDQPTSCGSWCYPDPNFSKLTDGVLGNAGWALNQGQEWVGWYAKPVVNIDFTFASQSQISALTFYTAQDNLGDVVFPSLDIYQSNDGVTWALAGSLSVPASSSNDHSATDPGPASFLTVSGLNIDAKYVRVAAIEEGPWTFASEVTFAGVSGVPEPATWAMMGLGFAGLGLAGLRSRRNAALA